MVDTPDEVFMHTVQELIYFSIIKIQYPLDLIPETPIDDVSEPNSFLEEEEFNSEYEDMEDNNDHNEERGNPPLKKKPWLARDVLALPRPVHNLP
jgi:hypothetical protein